MDSSPNLYSCTNFSHREILISLFFFFMVTDTNVLVICPWVLYVWWHCLCLLVLFSYIILEEGSFLMFSNYHSLDNYISSHQTLDMLPYFHPSYPSLPIMPIYSLVHLFWFQRLQKIILHIKNLPDVYCNF